MSKKGNYDKLLKRAVDWIGIDNIEHLNENEIRDLLVEFVDNMVRLGYIPYDKRDKAIDGLEKDFNLRGKEESITLWREWKEGGE